MPVMTELERLHLQRDTVARIKSARPAPLRKAIAPWARMPLPTTLVRVAARYAHLWRVTVSAAAREFGLPVSSVFFAWKRIYPDQPAVLCRRYTRAKASRKSAREERRALRVHARGRVRMVNERESHCYRVKLPTDAEARKILGCPDVPGYVPNDTERHDAVLCGAFGPPCFHCGGVSEALCDFPLGEQSRTCDRALCLECAPEVGADKNYCHEHDEHGRGMLLFPQPKRATAPPGPAPRKRAKPLPKAPPLSHRWRVRQGRGDSASHGAVLTDWKPQLDAHRFAESVGGYVETWDEFVVLWRKLYPIASAKPRSS